MNFVRMETNPINNMACIEPFDEVNRTKKNNNSHHMFSFHTLYIKYTQ